MSKKEHRVFYYNDEGRSVVVYVDTLEGPGTLLKPQQGEYFSVALPSQHILFIKRWDGYILIGTMFSEVKDERSKAN